MDCVIGVLIGLIIMLFIHFSVQMISFGVPEQIQNLKKLFGPKYRIRKRKDGVSYVEKRYLFWYNHCDYSFHKDINLTMNWLKDELDGKHVSIPDEIIETDIVTNHTVTIKE